MKLVAYGIAGLLALLGLIFVAGAQGQVIRVVVGVVLFLGAGGLIYLARLAPRQTTLVQKIELSGDVSAEPLTCQSCGGRLSRNSVRVEAGAVFVSCEFCGASYQLEEEPKW